MATHTVNRGDAVSYDWHSIGDTGEPAFQNSWVNFDGGYETAAFYKDAGGTVHLRGMIKTGTVGAVAFTLPAGYLSNGREIFGVISNGALGRVDVRSNGNIEVYTPSNNAYVALNGISFRAEG